MSWVTNETNGSPGSDFRAENGEMCSFGGDHYEWNFDIHLTYAACASVALICAFSVALLFGLSYCAYKKFQNRHRHGAAHVLANPGQGDVEMLQDDDPPDRLTPPMPRAVRRGNGGADARVLEDVGAQPAVPPREEEEGEVEGDDGVLGIAIHHI